MSQGIDIIIIFIVLGFDLQLFYMTFKINYSDEWNSFYSHPKCLFTLNVTLYFVCCTECNGSFLMHYIDV